jgi:hypothetical protein
VTHSTHNEGNPPEDDRQLDDKLVIEGLFTLVLQAERANGAYVFRTNSDGATIAKSPMGMFAETIPNDLAAMDDSGVLHGVVRLPL